MDKILIRVGSLSEHKIGAVRDACEALGIDADVVGIAAKSGVNEQPLGAFETTYGAKVRANEAWRSSEGVPDIAIGIESGIIPLVDPQRDGIEEEYVDCAFVCLRAGEYRILTQSAGHMVDPQDVREARRRGFDKNTVSSVTRERTNCDATDSTPWYTGGMVSRKECLQHAVKIALAQFLAEERRVRTS